MKKWLIILGLLILSLALGATPVLANTSEDITVTATGYVVGAPGGLTLTYISDYEVGISWTKGTDAVNTMVRAKYGSAPTSRTDGYLVYYGDGTSASDTGVSIEETAAPIYYRAWSQNAGGLWEEEGISGFFEGGGMTLIALFLFAGILSWLGMRSNFVLLRLMGGAGWLAMFIYWISSPPSAITKGSPAHTAIAVVLIGMTVAIPLVGLGREVSTQKDYRTGLHTETTGAFHFKVPEWMKVGEESPEEKSQKREASLEEYREKMHRALYPKRRKE
jgi:hypothetical protein